MNTPIWVRLPNLPLHFYTPDFLSLISNTLGRFIKTDTDRISKGFFTYARICVKIDLSQGLPDKIFFKRAGKDPYLQLIDYENTAFRCRSCQQKGHLQDSCPVFPFTPSSFGPRKKASRWQDPKSCNYHATPSAEGNQLHKESRVPQPSTTATHPSTAAQKPPGDSALEPSVSLLHPEASVMPSSEYVELDDMIMIIALLSRAQERPHESDHSDNDKEAHAVLAVCGDEIPPNQLSLVESSVAPTCSTGWIDVCKKKARREPPRYSLSTDSLFWS